MKIRNMVKKYTAPVALVAGAAVSPAFAALDATAVGAIKDAVIADAGTASTAGFAVMAVVLSMAIGFGLVQSFIRRGAQG
ncbi:hypothetical protein [Aeromonas sp. R9-1]|uniref:hypothetical protein n=1 Tax=Aeromonas sp. R9-1 TaxID=3138478 RepID=UPI0034A44FA7